MFDKSQLDLLDPKYFNIFTVDEYEVAIQSRCTGHCWYIRSVSDDKCIIFHKHKRIDQYHQHGIGYSLRHAIKTIKSHDKWQAGGRK